MYERGEIMIIGITGRCCSGKTTFIEHLRLERPDFGYVSESVRSVLRNMKTDLKTVRKSPEGYYLFQKLILQKHISDIRKLYDEGYKVIITDRTLYDVQVYSRLFLPATLSAKFDRFVDAHPDYLPDRLIYFEPLPYRDDGVRTGDKLDEELRLFEELVKPKADLTVNYMKDTFGDIKNWILKQIV